MKRLKPCAKRNSMTYEHICSRCKWWGLDQEILLVCPECASNEITNFETDEVKEEPKEESA
jgi:hypothetical protein